MQTIPDPGALANRRMRLALTRLLLSLTPLAACALLLLLPWATYPVVEELYALGVLRRLRLCSMGSAWSCI
jgi:hypothetical protein